MEENKDIKMTQELRQAVADSMRLVRVLIAFSWLSILA